MYSKLLAQKTTTLLLNQNGRKIYKVKISKATLTKYWTGMWYEFPVDKNFELKVLFDITGDYKDEGFYAVIDKTEQNIKRGFN